jgi:hypothetical protein
MHDFHHSDSQIAPGDSNVMLGLGREQANALIDLGLSGILRDWYPKTPISSLNFWIVGNTDISG